MSLKQSVRKLVQAMNLNEALRHLRSRKRILEQVIVVLKKLVATEPELDTIFSSLAVPDGGTKPKSLRHSKTGLPSRTDTGVRLR